MRFEAAAKDDLEAYWERASLAVRHSKPGAHGKPSAASHATIVHVPVWKAFKFASSAVAVYLSNCFISNHK